jgi:hypothetical protein
MSMFQCFDCLKKQKQKETKDEYTACGVVFTDGRHILAGYQPNKKNPCISGIGGMKEKGETHFDTAMICSFLFSFFVGAQDQSNFLLLCINSV